MGTERRGQIQNSFSELHVRVCVFGGQMRPWGHWLHLSSDTFLLWGQGWKHDSLGGNNPKDVVPEQQRPFQDGGHLEGAV